jgi:hypothetical protein
MLVAAITAPHDLLVVAFVIGLTYLLRHVLLFSFRFLGATFMIFGFVLTLTALSEGTGLRYALTTLAGGFALRTAGDLLRPRPAD